MKFFRSLLMVGALAMPATAHANLISNGNFASSCGTGSFCTDSAGDTSITNWNITQGSVDLITGYWQAPPSGGNSVDLDGNSPGGLSQSFATISGRTYEVTFYLSGNPDGGSSSKTVSVDLGGGNYTFDTAAEGNGHQDMKYLKEVFDFVATSGLTTLSFTSLDVETSPYGPVIGGVDVEAVPEPATLSLLGAGLFGGGWLARRRRKKQSVQEKLVVSQVMAN